MGTWSEVAAEIDKARNAAGEPDFDAVRRKYLLALFKHTRRNVILYASRWVQQGAGVPGLEVPASLLQVSDADLQGFMETVHGLRGDQLDLILHSPGGEPGAAEGIVTYLRTKFKHVRVIVPQLAMSAATMIACASDRIVMGKHSYLGPTDPQIIADGNVYPAQAILEQFERAQADCANTRTMGAWLPILPKYGPSLLVQCQNYVDLAKNLVEGWLSQYMLKDSPDRERKARRIAEWFADHKLFKTHSRHLGRARLRVRGLVVDSLEDDQVLQDLVLSVYHATTIVFQSKPGVAKIIENHLGRAFVTQVGFMPVGSPVQTSTPGSVMPSHRPPGAKRVR